MTRQIGTRSKRGAFFAGGLLWAVAAGLVLSGGRDGLRLDKAAASAARTPTGAPQLVSVAPLPPADGVLCEWMPARAETTLLAAWQQATASDAAEAAGSREVNRRPVRIIRDTYPTYAAIAQDPLTGDILLQDENLFGIRFFDRLTNTPPTAAFSEPKRMLRGEATKLEFNCGLYVDPKTGDIYSVNNDTTDMLVIFEHKAEGDVPPSRELRTPHGTYGIAVDEEAEEMFLTVEHTNAIVVYHKYAQGSDQPLRTIAGNNTQLEDPHGIAVDPKNGLILVSNHGNARTKDGDVVFGKFEPASVTVYPLKAAGNVAPLRIIEGPRTGFNWPAHLWVDSDRKEFYVANDGDDSILVFNIEDSGDVAPKRKIKGPATQIKNPTGVFLDAKHDELWVSNMGNHRATVYERTAHGNVAPKRVIRSAPPDKIAQAIGNPGAVAYDSKREEILVPN